MATTINAANISIGMDITKLKEGMGASRSEITQLRSILKESIDPVDKLKQQMTLLDRAFESGAIDVQQYNRSLDHLKTKLAEVNEKANAPGLSGLLKGQLGKMAGVAAGAFTISSIFGNVKEMDDIMDKAEQLGVSYEDLVTIGRTFEESGGLSFDQAGTALGKMQVNLANARDKGGDLANMLQRVGLSAGSLANMDAVSAFQQINTAFGQITNQADRMQFATELFGKAGIDMVPALQISAEKFAEMNQHLRETGVLQEGMQGNIQKAVDSVARLSDLFMGISANLAAEFGPTIQKVIQDVTGLLKPWQEIRDAIHDINEVAMLNPAMREMSGQRSMDANAFAAMSKEERAAWEDQWAASMASHIKKKRQQEADNAAIEQVLENARALNKKYEEQAKAEAEAAAAKQKALDAEQRHNDKLSNDIDNNLVKMTERDMASLESERQRLLGAGNQNVSATIAPAIKAGTVEAYKFMNKQNEDRMAREDNIRKLDEIKTELQKLNSERAVILSRIR